LPPNQDDQEGLGKANCAFACDGFLQRLQRLQQFCCGLIWLWSANALSTLVFQRYESPF
jgi:hypothetical protein